jgi:hypothetical protein
LRHDCGTPARHPAAKWTQRTRPGHLPRRVIIHGSAQITAMTDGRKRALPALAYHVGGLLAWSGQSREQIASQLIDAGIAAGLGTGIATRIVAVLLPTARPGPSPLQQAV